MTRKRYGNEQSLDVSQDFQENVLKVASRVKSKTSCREYHLELLESLTRFFEVIMYCLLFTILCKLRFLRVTCQGLIPGRKDKRIAKYRWLHTNNPFLDSEAKMRTEDSLE